MILVSNVKQLSNVHLLYNFFFNDTAATELFTLSLHDALPISRIAGCRHARHGGIAETRDKIEVDQLTDHDRDHANHDRRRSEEHTSELQSQSNLVCRLLLEKKNIHIQNLESDTEFLFILFCYL